MFQDVKGNFVREGVENVYFEERHDVVGEEGELSLGTQRDEGA